MKKENKEKNIITIPDGCFCGGNCSICIYYGPRNKDSDDRRYCNYYNTHTTRQKEKDVLIIKSS